MHAALCFHPAPKAAVSRMFLKTVIVVQKQEAGLPGLPNMLNQNLRISCCEPGAKLVHSPLVANPEQDCNFIFFLSYH